MLKWPQKSASEASAQIVLELFDFDENWTF